METDVATLGNQVAALTLAEPEQKSIEGQAFPLILTPTNGGFPSHLETCNWVRGHKEKIRALLLKYGVILFRDFPVREALHFDEFVKCLDYKPFPYVGGAAPRNVVVGHVFTTNESPPDTLIPYHHEMAQAPKFPTTLFFYCESPAKQGGETPIVPSNYVYRQIKAKEPEFVRELEEKGVRYVRILPEEDDHTSPIGRGWKSTYLTDDPEEAERKCGELGTSFEWLADGSMKTLTKAVPAIKADPRTGKKAWFNSVIAAYRGWKDSRNVPEKAVLMSDGTYMKPEVMDVVERTLDDAAVDFRWQPGDVLMVDNYQALHGRRVFTPPRRILAWLCV